MRVGFAATALLSFGSVLSLVGCGGEKKEAKDPTSETTPTASETAPKWEGAAPPEPPKPRGATVNEAPAHRSDQYDKDATEVVLKRASRQVKDNCGAAKDDSGKAVGPWGKGTVQVMLGHNGHSKGVVVPPPFQGKPSGNCVEQAFSNLTFPPWAGEDTQVEWPINVLSSTATPKP